jgi:hypothetical protein
LPKRLATHLRTLDSREEKLDTLLEKYEEAQETLHSGCGRDDSADGGLFLMPPVWNTSYRELERCLNRMRGLAGPEDLASLGFRLGFIAITNWYLRAKRKRAPLIRVDKKGREYHVTTANGPQYVILVTRTGNPTFVLKGLEWLSAEFVGEIYLPSEFLLEVA